jgi:uncharacterized membrane protein
LPPGNGLTPQSGIWAIRGRPCDVFVLFDMEAAPRYDGPTSSNEIFNGGLMSELIVISYNDQFKAEETRLKFLKMQREHLVDLEDAVVAIKQPNGKVKLNQIHDLTEGAIGGGFWGALVGLIFLNPLFGAAGGAAAGAISSALLDVGINDDFMKELADTLQPGSSALFVLVRKSTADKVLEELRGTGGKIIKTSLSHDDEAKLQAALDAAKAS